MAKIKREISHSVSLSRMQEERCIRIYIKQLGAELAQLRGGPDARCTKLFKRALAKSRLTTLTLQKLLQRALAKSEHTDCRLALACGRIAVHGHREMLCRASEEFANMSPSGMEEEREGLVNLPECVTEGGARALLEERGPFLSGCTS